MKKLIVIASFILVGWIFPSHAAAAAVTWDSGAGTANWEDANNWSGDAVPTADDDVTIATTSALTVNIAAATTVNSLTVGNSGGTGTATLNFNYDGIANGALTLDAGNLTVYSGAKITHTLNGATLQYRVNIDVVAGDATIVSGGSFDASAKGFFYNHGTGTAMAASYGGIGAGTTPGATYGSVTEPYDLGSGGNANPGYGGGAVKLTVFGTLTVAGNILVNANNDKYTGPTGGSIYLSANTITGAGTIAANGSGAWGGNYPGGGGRIAVYYTTNTLTNSPHAYGGYGTGQVGGAGTVFLKSTAQTYGEVLIDNNNYLVFQNALAGETPLPSGTFDIIRVQNYGRLDVPSSSTVTYTTLDWSTKGILIDNSSPLAIFANGANIVVPATAYLYANTARTWSSVEVDGVLTHSENTNAETYRIVLNVTGNFNITSTGSINLDGQGHSAGYGLGHGASGVAGGYGGNGGGYNGTLGMAYGSIGNPTNIGSGGNSCCSSEAGGAVILTVGGTMTVNGPITANTTTTLYSASSGGTVNITADTITGSAAIRANGGTPSSGAPGGGGGRIALYYHTAYSLAITPTVTHGTGRGNPDGQDGTLVIKATYGEITSNPFDSGDPATLVYDLTWTEALPTGTDVQLQLRTAPDNNGTPGTWTDWMGPGGVGTYFTDPTGLTENIAAAQSDASNDQWFQYKIILTAAALNEYIPTVADVTVTYVVNTPPTVTMTNTPEESSTGTVTVNYTVSDPEESTLTSYLAVDIGATLTSDYAINVTTDLPLSSTAYLPSSGAVMIDNEVVTYTGISGNTLTGITRGTNSFTDASHASGTVVWFIAPAASVTGDYGSLSSLGSKSLVWTPASDLTGLETTTAKIKIVGNDGNLANQVGASSAVTSVILDTKAPTGGEIFINKYTGKISLSASDANAIYYNASNNAGLIADGVNANSGTWVAYATPVDWTFAGDPSTVYVAYKDAYGNTTSTFSTVSPTRLSSLIIQDASNPATSEWRLFVSWVVGTDPAEGFAYYQLYRSTDGSTYTPYQQINNSAENYYVDAGLDSATTYYYKTTIVDNHGNESDTNYPIQTSGAASRSGVGLTPDGSGGGDFTAPVISAVAISGVTTTGATVSWTTDELADSRVGFSTDTSYDTEKGSISMVASHSVALTNLTPGTKYYYRLISYDATNNKANEEDSSTQYFTTLADSSGPVISNIKSVVGETSAGITWSTDEDSTSKVEYSVDTGFGSSSASATLVLGHALTLTGLTVDTTYNYHVISVDGNSNSTTSPDYTFKTSAVTASDTTAPSISDISVSDITATSAKVSWKTSEDADGKVEYGESTSYERGIAEGNHDFKTTKSVSLIGLSPEATYHYRVTVIDEAGNTNTSSDATFATSAESTVDLSSDSGSSSGASAPSITSTGATVTEITGTSVTINWDTSKKSTSQVYYKIKNSLDAPSSSGDVTFTTAHVVALAGLTPATTYEYQVKSADVNGNYVTSAKYEFTTTLPGVTGIKVVNKSATSVDITWLTAVPTTTVVEYTDSTTGETKQYSNASLLSNHLATLTNLYPGSLYAFTVMLSDEAGNLARSDQYSFKTGDDKEGPKISNVNSRSTIVAGQNKVQTVITWNTDEPTTSQVEYSLGTGSGNYDSQTRINPDFVLNHIMVIANLKPGSVYRYRVLTADRASNSTASEAYVLLTPQKEVSALDLIIQNLQSSFGWVSKLQ